MFRSHFRDDAHPDSGVERRGRAPARSEPRTSKEVRNGKTSYNRGAETYNAGSRRNAPTKCDAGPRGSAPLPRAEVPVILSRFARDPEPVGESVRVRSHR